MLYGTFGGTALYLQQINDNKDVEENIKNAFLRTTAYLYEEPLLLLRQEVQEPGIYSAIIEAIAGGAQDAVWLKRVKPNYNEYMGIVFEKICCDYLMHKNAAGELPIFFTDIGR